MFLTKLFQTVLLQVPSSLLPSTTRTMSTAHHTTGKFRTGYLNKPGTIYHEPTPRYHRAWVQPTVDISKDEPVLNGKDLSLIWEDGFGVGYIAFPKSQVPFGKSNARGGHYFSESTTPRQPKQGKSNLASQHYDLVEASSGNIVKTNAAWIWDPSKVNDTAPENAYPHLGQGKSPLGDLVGIDEYAFKTWYEEAEQIIPGGHVKDPYHRVDTVPTDRHVQIYSLDGDLLAESKNAHICFETGFVDRYYFDKKDVIDSKTLSPELTPLKTVCPYKGEASYYNVTLPSGKVLENQVWVYETPLAEATKLEGLVAFWVPGPNFKLVVNGEEIKNQ